MTALRWYDVVGLPTPRSRKAVHSMSCLFVGLLAEPVARLVPTRSGDHWRVTSDLPMHFTREWGTLDEMKEYVAHRVEVWLQVAAHDEPILLEGAGI